MSDFAEKFKQFLETMDRKKLIYMICGLIAIGTAAALLISGTGKTEGSGPIRPEEVTEAFCRAIASGDMKTACTLCDIISMKEYMDACRSTWEEAMKQASTAADIAKGIMDAMEFRTDDVSKDGNISIVSYTIRTPEGQCKSKEARLRKEEGAWIVERITDRQ